MRLLGLLGLLVGGAQGVETRVVCVGAGDAKMEVVKGDDRWVERGGRWFKLLVVRG